MGVDLRKLGFKTGRVVMPGLGLETRLEPGQYFRNDGVVDSIRRHYSKIAKELMCLAIEKHTLENNPFVGGGRSLQLESRNKKFTDYEKAAIQFIRDHSYPENIFATAHESVHTAIFFDKKDELTDYVISQGFNIDLFKVFDEEEHIADFGGLVSMHRRGRDDYGNIRVAPFVLEAFLDSRKKKVTSVYH